MVDVSARMADDKRRDFRIEAAIAKLYAARLVDQHLTVAGEILLGDSGVATNAKLKAAGVYAKWFPALGVGKGHNPAAYSEFGILGRHLRYAERSSRKLARSTFYAMGRYQAKLEHKGALLGRVVDIGAELFAIAAACTYAATCAREDPANREAVYELADLFCCQARRRADHLFRSLWSNDDRAQYERAQSVLKGRYELFEHGIADPASEGPMIPDLLSPGWWNCFAIGVDGTPLPRCGGIFFQSAGTPPRGALRRPAVMNSVRLAVRERETSQSQAK